MAEARAARSRQRGLDVGDVRGARSGNEGILELLQHCEALLGECELAPRSTAERAGAGGDEEKPANRGAVGGVEQLCAKDLLLGPKRGPGADLAVLAKCGTKAAAGAPAVQPGMVPGRRQRAACQPRRRRRHGELRQLPGRAEHRPPRRRELRDDVVSAPGHFPSLLHRDIERRELLRAPRQRSDEAAPAVRPDRAPQAGDLRCARGR
mmetsp:Transcript_89107/g.256858  ORF Transcript_89107/g.256858 Transcript_89107/m.256858 type:complete len:208 (-) Transcript_89107:70-693(-)